MKLEQNKFYVYEHWYNGQCFYVGSGKYRRAYDWKREGRRSEEWYNFCNRDYKKIEVRIVEEFDNDLLAIDFEKALTMYNDYILKMPLVNKKTGNSAYGKSNAMYGKNVKDYMTPEAYEAMRKKQGKNLSGEKHHKAIKIIAYNIYSNETLEFSTKKFCSDYFKGTFSWLSIMRHMRGEQIIKINESGWRFKEG